MDDVPPQEDEAKEAGDSKKVVTPDVLINEANALESPGKVDMKIEL